MKVEPNAQPVTLSSPLNTFSPNADKLKLSGLSSMFLNSLEQDEVSINQVKYSLIVIYFRYFIVI